ncbi:MAG TPA: choice-of-anchor Q domain-containing protein [Candidatus Acidoferrales bacterium]|nr:choice-of-anchor Q domain-containing protein [Candidatus Acidoferrales bacterium]
MLFRLFFAVSGIWLCLAPAARAAVDTVTTTADAGPGSLRNTIAAAGSGDTIAFSPTLAGHIIYLTSGELLIGQNVTIDASALLPGGIAINGSGISRVMEIGSGTLVSLNALTVTNGFVNGDPGAGVLLDDTTCSLTASRCIFCGNSGDEYGGAICAYGALTLNSCTVSGNSASVFGGGIFGYGGPVTLNNCTLSGNSVTDGGGGGIENEFGALTLNNCTVSSNIATAFGGGIDAEDEGSLALTNCVFIGNSSETAGALSAETVATASNCTFSNNICTNSTGGTGGGIVNYETMTLCNCSLAGNNVNSNGTGGGVVNSGTLTMTNCTIFGNSAVNGSGGGIYNPGSLTANNCKWLGNAANKPGGGIYNGGTLMLSYCTLSGNAATNGQGGGIFNQQTLTLDACTLDANSAINGGGIANRYGGGDPGVNVCTANNCTLFGNVATNGGGIFNAVSLTLNNCTLDGNAANAGYGGAICNESADAASGENASNFLINCTVYGNAARGGMGGGLYKDSSSLLALTNTIVASNSAEAYVDVNGAYSGVANFVGGSPELAGLANYGGNLLTLSPMLGSPVIDAGTDWVTNFLATDQRGFPRLAGAHVDIGAVEAQTAPANNRPDLRISVYIFGTNYNSLNSFRLSFANVPNADFTVYSSTNLTFPMAKWTELGNAPGSGGRFQFLTPANNPAQFFRVVSP